MVCAQGVQFGVQESPIPPTLPHALASLPNILYRYYHFLCVHDMSGQLGSAEPEEIWMAKDRDNQVS